MKKRAWVGAVAALALTVGQVQAGGLAAPEVESEVFGVEQPAAAAGGLGGTRTLALIAGLVLVAAIASGGGGDDDEDEPAVEPEPEPEPEIEFN